MRSLSSVYVVRFRFLWENSFHDNKPKQPRIVSTYANITNLVAWKFKRDQSLYRISSDRNFAVHYNVRDASNYLTTNREKQDVREWRAKTGGKDKKVEEGIKLAQTGCGRYSPTMKMVHLRSTCLVNCTHDWAYVALAFA